ncbi:MAG: class I SAM-dependent DNA methyltransferase [Candidatus Melainabacteria bacterium]|nr:class I SAM-dependent DNA methyltransferase [Candidatus Melainabacteria bacterium]
MNLSEIEDSIRVLLSDFDNDSFIYGLLGAYGKPKASITRLQKGNLNLSKRSDEIIWKRNVYYKAVSEQKANVDIHVIADQLKRSDEITKHDLRFVIVTDFETLLAIDTKTSETLDIPIEQLARHAHFFLPWTGQEKHKSQGENPADIKAAYKMGKLYDEICGQNPLMRTTESHSLNVFLARLLFCFFAEDTEIFPVKGMFTNSIASHTQEDASDLSSYLDRLWTILNTEKRKEVKGYFEKFPYVNGGLFSEKLIAPKFSRLARKIILECGELDWSEINPDIFGSMMQAVVHSEDRGSMHYTSVSNIMKVIGPLFLDDLRLSFDESFDNQKGLEKLRTRLGNIRIFDPACGSGNFLIIAFKELRRLEMEIFMRLRELDLHYQTLFTLPQIQLTQFFGIELEDFAHEIAILSLWLAEHQMNVKFKQNLGILVPALPLKAGGHIVCANATQIDWHSVCPADEKRDVYLLGNPPYIGARNQTENQKKDMIAAFRGVDNFKKLDYIACWFYKGAQFVRNNNASLAFVSTNSICQGELVAILWPLVLEMNLEISFAHRPFHWSNNAKHNAGVTVVIIGLRNWSKRSRLLFDDGKLQEVENINPYLASGKDIIVEKRTQPLSRLPQMSRGNAPTDDGNFMLTAEERSKLISQFPETESLIKRVWGANEFIKGIERWCLWLDKTTYETVKHIPFVAARVKAVATSRLDSPKEATQRLASVPWEWDEIRHQETTSVIIPTVSSENREYIPVGFLGANDVIIAPNQAIYKPEPWIVGVLSSKMHNVWVHAVAGRMRSDIRYSIVLCYNTFPIPELSERQKELLSSHVFNIMAERENHSERTLAQLYDSEKMPMALKQAHADLDLAIERCYRSKPFQNDSERLDFLFKSYEVMLEMQKGAVRA